VSSQKLSGKGRRYGQASDFRAEIPAFYDNEPNNPWFVLGCCKNLRGGVAVNGTLTGRLEV